MDHVNYIVKMRHYSERLGADGSARGFIRAWREQLHRTKAIRVDVKVEEEARGAAVKAYIHQGQWVAECDQCNGHEFTDPADPVFFCWGCVNRANNGYLRPVIFPENWEEIERLILERPVNDLRGATDLERAGLAQAALVVRTADGEYPLVRSWKPDESLDELRKQNEVLKGVEIFEGRVTVVDLTPASPPHPQTPLPLGEGGRKK